MTLTRTIICGITMENGGFIAQFTLMMVLQKESERI